MTMMPDDSTWAEDMTEGPRREPVDTYEKSLEHRDTTTIDRTESNDSEKATAS
jgi:hypothetical protein